MNISQSVMAPNKKGDYFSTSGELIFQKFAKKDPLTGAYEKGFYGLPTPMEVSQDLMV